jgi:hypothetical protein
MHVSSQLGKKRIEGKKGKEINKDNRREKKY